MTDHRTERFTVPTTREDWSVPTWSTGVIQSNHGRIGAQSRLHMQHRLGSATLTITDGRTIEEFIEHPNITAACWCGTQRPWSIRITQVHDDHRLSIDWEHQACGQPPA